MNCRVSISVLVESMILFLIHVGALVSIIRAF